MNLHNLIEVDVARTEATPLSAYISDYLIACEAGSAMRKPLTPKSIRGYRKTLRELDVLMGRPTLAGFTEAAVTEVVMAKRRRSKSAARLMAATAKAFSAWLHRKKHTTDNRLADMATPVFNGRRRAFSDIEFRRIITALDDMPGRTIRCDRAAVLLGMSTGIRVGEMWALRKDDVHIEKPLSQSWVRVEWDTTKTKHERMVVMSEDAAVAIHEYITRSRPDVTPDGRTTENMALFLKGNGEEYTEEGWQKHITQGIGRKLAAEGVGKFMAHRMRHQWATMGARERRTSAELRQEGGWTRGSRVPDNYIEEIPLEDMQRRGSPMTTFLRRVV